GNQPNEPSPQLQSNQITIQQQITQSMAETSNHIPVTSSLTNPTTIAGDANPLGEKDIEREMREMLSKMIELSKMNPAAFKAVWESVKTDGPASAGREPKRTEGTQHTELVQASTGIPENPPAPPVQ